MSSKVIREKRPLVTTVEARSPLQLFEPASRSTPGGGQEEVIEEEMALPPGRSSTTSTLRYSRSQMPAW